MSGVNFDIAEYDQLLARADSQLDALRQTLRSLESRRGEPQAMADVMAMLETWDRTEVTSVLMAALRERQNAS